MSLNFGHTQRLLARVITEYANHAPARGGKPGFVAADFARHLGCNPSDMTRWAAGEREAGAFFDGELCKYLAEHFGDALLAFRTVYGDTLKTLGLSVSAHRLTDAERRGAALHALEVAAESVPELVAVTRDASAGGSGVAGEEVPRVRRIGDRFIAAGKALHEALPPDPQETLPGFAVVDGGAR